MVIKNIGLVVIWVGIICFGANGAYHALSNENAPKYGAMVGGYCLGMGVCGLMSLMIGIAGED